MRPFSNPLARSLRWKSFANNTHRFVVRSRRPSSIQPAIPSRSLAQVRLEPFSEVWFTASWPAKSLADDLLGPQGEGHDHKPPDERTLRLGKSAPAITSLL